MIKFIVLYLVFGFVVALADDVYTIWKTEYPTDGSMFIQITLSWPILILIAIAFTFYDCFNKFVENFCKKYLWK